MATRTNKSALMAILVPFYLPSGTVEFLLEEQGLDPLDGYVKDDMEEALYKAAIQCLLQLLPLTEEHDAGSTHKYDTDAIRERIGMIAKRFGWEDPVAEEKFFYDRTNEW